MIIKVIPIIIYYRLLSSILRWFCGGQTISRAVSLTCAFLVVQPRPWCLNVDNRSHSWDIGGTHVVCFCSVQHMGTPGKDFSNILSSEDLKINSHVNEYPAQYDQRCSNQTNFVGNNTKKSKVQNHNKNKCRVEKRRNKSRFCTFHCI